jgi:voltage-gated potassium channel
MKDDNKAFEGQSKRDWKERLRRIVFETDTAAGKTFDIILIIAILCSVLIVLLASVPSLQERFGLEFIIAEWIVTILFSAEYLARVVISPQRWKYVFSFFGIIDLLSTMPTYLSLFIPGSESLLVIRLLRVLRIFRIFKMGRYVSEARVIAEALKASIYKISVFILTVLVLVTILGTLMYLVEGSKEDSKFLSIPMSIYWAIVTLTTVGFGDLVPETVLGQILASLIMLMGYAIIAVPTGLVTAEFIRHGGPINQSNVTTEKSRCLNCGHELVELDASFCSKCGESLG